MANPDLSGDTFAPVAACNMCNDAKINCTKKEMVVPVTACNPVLSGAQFHRSLTCFATVCHRPGFGKKVQMIATQPSDSGEFRQRNEITTLGPGVTGAFQTGGLKCTTA